MFKQPENATLDAIRWMEHLNSLEEYNGAIKHAYNAKEKKFGNYSIDGYAETLGFPTNKRVLFEYRGCTCHSCPHCKIRPFRAMKKWIKDPKSGKKTEVKITRDELLEREETRLRAILAKIREIDNLSILDSDFDSSPSAALNASWHLHGGRFGVHQIIIKYACQWRKEWAALENEGRAPRSNAYPGLFKGTPLRQSGMSWGDEGITEDEFKQWVLEEEEGSGGGGGKPRFFGFAVVDLSSPPDVIKRHPHIPPIFTKRVINLEDLQGDLQSTLSAKQKKRMFPACENVFCYNAENYLATSEVLNYYAKKGLVYKVKYFVSYYRARPFRKFINSMVADRVQAIKDNQQSLQNWIKFIMNSAVGYFAIDRSKFLQTQVITSGKLYSALRNPRLKSLTPLTVEGHQLDPLHEAVAKKRRVVHSTALQVQIAVYQNSKLRFFRFLDVLRDYLVPGKYKMCYADTDSFLLALTEKTLIECVRPDKLAEWNDKIAPKWFAIDTPESSKEPGLLKEEASIESGWFIAISPKAYIMAECERSELEDQLVSRLNRERVYEILNENRDVNNGKIKKRSAKGCHRNVELR